MARRPAVSQMPYPALCLVACGGGGVGDLYFMLRELLLSSSFMIYWILTLDLTGWLGVGVGRA